MANFGDVALRAVALVRSGRKPGAAWDEAAREVLPGVAAAASKGGPRGAFLGLCEDEKIVGINAGEYTTSKENKRYALRAVNFLRQEPALEGNSDALWHRVAYSVAHNGQIDVVLALWKAGLIDGSPHAMSSSAAQP